MESAKISTPPSNLNKQVRTLTIIQVIIAFLIFYGIYQVISGQPIQSLVLSIGGLITFLVAWWAKKQVKSSHANQAGFMIIITISVFVLAVVWIDPGNSWIIGPTTALLLIYFSGMFTVKALRSWPRKCENWRSVLPKPPRKLAG